MASTDLSAISISISISNISYAQKFTMIVVHCRVGLKPSTELSGLLVDRIMRNPRRATAMNRGSRNASSRVVVLLVSEDSK